MNITCPRNSLAHAVQTVQKAVATKTPLPILTGIYLSANNNILELQATDYEIGISCKIEAQVDEPGKIVLSGKYFMELVRRLAGDTIQIQTHTEDNTIKITSQYSQFNLLNLPAEEFPVIKPIISDKTLVLRDNVLKDLIKKTVFACATDESRPIFTGALLETMDNKVTMVGTNTHRLALKQDEIDNYTGNSKIIIPAKILHELVRIFNSDIPQNVTITWHKNQVAFSIDNIYIISRIIEGNFPDYNKVIPANFATTVKIKTDDFLDAVERVSLLSRDGEYNIIKFKFKEDSITITSNNPDIGKASDNVPADIQGNELEIAFNAKYITDILKNVDSDDILFNLNTPLSPASIKPIEDDKYIYIITPVRTN